MKRLLVSIIIPCYNVEKYIDRCMNSVVGQTYQNLEIILVDDGSTDATPEKCDAWAEKDERIKVYHSQNKGAANSRNFALSKSTGELIAFIDSDDYAEPDMIERLCENLNTTNADISVCGYHINDEKNVESDMRIVSQTDALKLIAIGDYKYGVLWNKLYRKEIVHGIQMPQFVCSEDLIFNYYAFKNAKKIVECDSKLYHYMQNESSTVHSEFKIGAFDAVKAKEIILEAENGTELEKYAIRGLINSCFVVLSGVIQSGKCLDKYDYLRGYISKYKEEIYSSDLYSREDKIKTRILMISKHLYNMLIRVKYRI